MPMHDAALVDMETPPVDAIDAAPGDADGDGVANASDNCPSLANADQHTEDGDATFAIRVRMLRAAATTAMATASATPAIRSR